MEKGLRSHAIHYMCCHFSFKGLTKSQICHLLWDWDTRTGMSKFVDRPEMYEYDYEKTREEWPDFGKKDVSCEKLKEYNLCRKEHQAICPTVLREQCKENALELLKYPKSLCTLELAFREQGLIGETKNAFATFFDMLSTLTRNPINRRWSGRSGLGKTAIVTKVAAVFPPEMLIIRAGLTKKAVWHMPGSEEVDERTRLLNLKGKILVILEESESQEFLNDAKPLLSHDLPELKYEFTEKTAEGLTTFIQVLHGWPVYIGITTVPELREEQQTRALIGTPERGERKYRCIITADAALSALPWETPKIEYTPIVQEAVRQLKPLKVWIPWLPIVAQDFPSKEAKSMREWFFFRSMLESITLWFQFVLPHISFNGEEYICAPPFILELGLLIGEVAFKETIMGLEKDVADFIEHLRTHGPDPWTYQQLLKEYRDCFGENICKTSLQKRYTEKLVDLGLLELDDSKKPYRLSLGEKSSPSSTILENSLEKVKSEETKRILASKTSCFSQSEYTLPRPVLPDGKVVSWEQLWDYVYSLDLEHDVKKLLKRSKQQEYPEKSFSIDSGDDGDGSGEKKPENKPAEPTAKSMLKPEDVAKLHRLSAASRGKCESCGRESRMDWQAIRHDGSCVLLCGDCGYQLEGQMGGAASTPSGFVQITSEKQESLSKTEKKLETISIQTKAIYHKIPPAEPCELCGAQAVEVEVMMKDGSLLRRCMSCFKKMRVARKKVDFVEEEHVESYS
jgi:ribosome-binding protein aMBF1 (putative translation factor)